MKKSKSSRMELRTLERLANDALNNLSFEDAIQVFQKHYDRYHENEKYLLLLGMLYDHVAQGYKHGYRKPKSKRESDLYFEKALVTFRKILKKNPHSYNALYGIGKVFRNQGKYKKALLYSRNAYRIAKNKKAVYGIGFIYELMGDYRNAERWYLKEIQDKGIDDFNAVSNYLFFTDRQYKRKMREYAQIAQQLYNRQPLSYRRSAAGQALQRVIARILDPETPK